MRFWIVVFILLGNAFVAESQSGTVRQIEPCACQVSIDSSFSRQCAYLVVPENRKKKNGKTVKLPFIIVQSKSASKRADPILYTAGGPGGSSLGWSRNSPQRSEVFNRDCIAFEQRGTRYSIPNVWDSTLDDAIREAYRKNLDKDSMMLEGTKRYKKSLQSKGIDLSVYNTDESVADIQDLLATLHIDSVNLFGGSYSGGLMLAVLKKDPRRIRSLVLDSPLPTFVRIDEEEPANLGEALKYLFTRVEADSSNKGLYENLEHRFETYFNSIASRVFTISYLEKGNTSPVNIQYGRRELLDILNNAMYESPKDIPFLITQFMEGNHYEYIKNYLDRIFRGGISPSGMRISVYCADQTAYHSEDVLNQLYELYPYLRGFHINDVYKAMCDCWNVPPIDPRTKQPFYSDKPALLADGKMDNACNPVYIDLIHHYMPNSQRALFLTRSHGVGGKTWNELVAQFLDDPFRLVKTTDKSVVVY